MRSKTPLVLMEQLVMILVFALAAAMCVQTFVFSDRISRKNEAAATGALLSQNVAEEIKSRGKALSETLDERFWQYGDGFWFQDYDETWNLLGAGEERESEYRVEVHPEVTEVVGLFRARIAVTGDGEVLFEIPVAWQEVNGHE